MSNLLCLSSRFSLLVCAVLCTASVACSFEASPAGPATGGGGQMPTVVFPQPGGPGGTGGAGGGTGNADGGLGCGSNLTGVLRDFKQAHPDMEEFTYIGDDRGMVEPHLGANRKPVYAGRPKTPTTTGRDNFEQWFRDVPGVNQGVFVTLPFQDRGGGLFTYDNSQFFPIDGMLWGNEGHPHNYHFTFELHTRFLYKGGEVFRFRGDDDVFTFINGKLVVDLGGIHLPEEATVNLDAEAGRLGLTPGRSYDLDFFFAERHLAMSNFRIDTTLFFLDCGIVVP